MISEIQREDILINLNQDINDSIERLWTKSVASTKEQKEKNINEIFFTFLKRLNTHLNESNTAEITDLIFEKSIFISEVIGNYDWPNAETLKVSNLHRCALFFYSYIKSRISLFHPKAKKASKEIQLKACENLIQMLNVLIELPIISKLQPNCLHVIFQDLFAFYSMITIKTPTLTEEIEGIISLYNEETNIASLAKMKSIDKTAETNFFIGSLITLLSYKMNLSEKIIDETVVNRLEMEMKTIHSHFELLNQQSYLTSSEYSLFITLNALIKGESTTESFKLIIELFFKGKKYLSFLKHSKLIDVINYNQNLLRVLIVLVIVENKLKISALTLEYLNYNESDVYGLLNANITNLLPIKMLLKGKENSLFNILNLSNRIIERLIKGGRNGELTYSMLFPDSTKYDNNKTKSTFDELDAESYLHNVIKEKYKPHVDLQKQLEAIK